MLEAGSYKRVPVHDVETMLAFRRELPPQKLPQWWLFRGMPRNFPLQTSIERAVRDAEIDLKDAPSIECALLKEFKRRAHFYVNPLPNEGDVLGWIALMQHYGAPTRLLDWTYSFFVAAFFAISETPSRLSDDADPAVVWALYRDAFKLESQAPAAKTAYEAASSKSSWQRDLGRADADNIYDGINAYLLHVMENPVRSVWAVNAFRLNERLSVQQGLFLCPGDLTVPFEENLAAAGPTPGNLVRFEFATEAKARAEMLGALHTMNINNTSLFPGLDGFARSLKQAPLVRFRLRPETPSHG